MTTSFALLIRKLAVGGCIVDLTRRSELLFGRHQALTVYAAIASLAKPEFTTGDVVKLTGVPAPVCSKELARLAALAWVRAVSRRGEYERLETSCWAAILLLAEFESETEDNS